MRYLDFIKSFQAMQYKRYNTTFFINKDYPLGYRTL